jgi:hypothetical protein
MRTDKNAHHLTALLGGSAASQRQRRQRRPLSVHRPPVSRLPQSLLLAAALSLGAASILNAADIRNKAENPILWADVPDMAMIRVGENYYMSSTTMHMSPGLPIMKSKDLVNWEIAGYAYDILDDVDELNLKNGRNAYGAGSWASSLRYHDGVFCATTFSSTTGKTYVYTTKNIEKGPWNVVSFRPSLHDHSLFFDDDGRVYMIYGGGDLRLVELKEDFSGLKPGGNNHVVIVNASAVAGPNIGLKAEGCQLFKVNGKYYLFNITWPRGGMRTVLIHRADKITGPYEIHRRAIGMPICSAITVRSAAFPISCRSSGRTAGRSSARTARFPTRWIFPPAKGSFPASWLRMNLTATQASQPSRWLGSGTTTLTTHCGRSPSAPASCG